VRGETSCVRAGRLGERRRTHGGRAELKPKHKGPLCIFEMKTPGLQWKSGRPLDADPTVWGSAHKFYRDLEFEMYSANMMKIDDCDAPPITDGAVVPPGHHGAAGLHIAAPAIPTTPDQGRHREIKKTCDAIQQLLENREKDGVVSSTDMLAAAYQNLEQWSEEQVPKDLPFIAMIKEYNAGQEKARIKSLSDGEGPVSIGAATVPRNKRRKKQRSQTEGSTGKRHRTSSRHAWSLNKNRRQCHRDQQSLDTVERSEIALNSDMENCQLTWGTSHAWPDQ
jgi:hypothetical protein